MSMPKDEARAIEAAERVASVCSVVGAIFIIATFLCDHRFRKPINRLVFYASWGNLFANVATLISRSGIKLGIRSPLCQFQAFLIQWFMPADALWTFAMACNVYLTFFRQYDSAALRTLEWKYLVFCYGLPFVPAFIYCFVETAKRGKFYGSANLWCWVSSEWNVFRIATFYGPVWVIIVINVFIYIKVGTVVFKWRSQLLSMDRFGNTQTNPRDSSAVTVSVPMREMRSPQPSQTYEVSIVSQVPHHSSNHSKHLSLTSPTTPTPTHARFPSTNTALDEQANVYRTTTIVHPVRQPPPRRAVDANRATISYCYTALLFFLALLVTWVPSTVNRVYTLVNSDTTKSPFALDFASSLVLPLQGFWNTVIYIVTSLPACKVLISDIHDSLSCRYGSGVPSCSGFPPSLKRHAAQLGSTDSNDRERKARSQPSDDYNHKRSHSYTQSNGHKSIESHSSGNAEGQENMRSPRADIVMSFDGKKRVIHHDYRSSRPENTYSQYGEQQQHQSHDHQQQTTLPREYDHRGFEQDQRLSQRSHDYEEKHERFFVKEDGNRTSLNYDSSSDEEEANGHGGGGVDEYDQTNTDSKAGFAQWPLPDSTEPKV